MRNLKRISHVGLGVCLGALGLIAAGCGVRVPAPAPQPTTNAAPGQGGGTAPTSPVVNTPPQGVQAEAEEPAATTVAPGATAAGANSKQPGATPQRVATPLFGRPKSCLANGSSVLPPAMMAEKIELRDGVGLKSFSFRNKGADAVKFYDASGTELCKLTVSFEKLKAKTPDDQPLFELKHKEDKTTLRLPPNDLEIWKFKIRGERLEIHTADDRLTYVVWSDGATVVLERPDGKVVCRAQREGAATKVSDAQGKLLFTSDAIADPLALVFFGLSELDPMQQAACLVFFLRKNPS